MAELRVPEVSLRPSYLSAIAEFAAEGCGAPGDRSHTARQIRTWSGIWESDEGFSTFVEELRAESDPRRARPRGLVTSTTWWWVEGDEYLGRIALRHRLNKELLEVAGHIGYEVRPSARRRGNATEMLAALLPLVHAVGIEAVLVTCDVANLGSRKVIEANGGVLEDERHGKLRFWIPRLPGRHDSTRVRYDLPAATCLLQQPVARTAEAVTPARARGRTLSLRPRN